jgi:DNA-binding MurR/RpiR family transcriptional regulator
MSGILAKIKAGYNSFSASEKKVADYILKNPAKVPFQSVYEMADFIGVSVPTVTRMTKKIGYQNFKNFKLDLAVDTVSSVADIYSEISILDSDEDLARKVFSSNIQALEDTLKIINFNDLSMTAKVISYAKRTIFFGVGGSGLVAMEAALRFSHLDLQAEAYCDPLQMLVQAKRLKENCIAIGISHSGRTKQTIQMLSIARENKAMTAGISNYIDTPLKEECKYYLCTSFAESRVKAASLSSRTAQLCLVDVLYLMVAKYRKKIWDLEDLNDLIEKKLRT